jgi:hypothetical protein
MIIVKILSAIIASGVTFWLIFLFLKNNVEKLKNNVKLLLIISGILAFIILIIPFIL